MNNRLKNSYSGQAIAIVMVVLVVAAVLGASLYSRALRNNQNVIQGQDSDVALEQADLVLGLFSEVDIDVLDQLLVDNSEEVSYQDIDEFTAIANLLSDEGKSTVAQISNWCSDDTASSLNLKIKGLSNTEYIDIRVGNSRTFNFETAPVLPSGSMTINVEPRGMDHPVFGIQRVYKDASGVFKAYEDQDINNYCLGDVVEDCEQNVSPKEAVIPTNGNIVIDLNPVSGFNIWEIKVVPLVGDIAVNYGPTEVISGLSFRYMKVNVGVNCYGSYREKEMVIPGVKSLGSSTLFDYSLYNIGTLNPN